MYYGINPTIKKEYKSLEYISRAVNNYLYSGFEFEDDNHEMKSRYFFLNIIFAISGGFILLLGIVLRVKGENYFSTANFIFLGVLLSFVFMLRKSTTIYNIIVPSVLLGGFVLVIVALIEYPNEDVRIAWFSLIITMAYYLGGIYLGNIATLMSLMMIFIVRVLINGDTDHYITMLSIVITFLVAVFSNLYEKRNIKSKARLIELNSKLESKVKVRTKELLNQKDRLEYQAHHDALTGLPNRTLFNIELEKEIEKASLEQKTFALFFIDLDNFKHINDSLGHGIGDSVLNSVTSRLLGRIRKKDTLSRIGGDEFTVIMRDISNPQDASRLGQNLLDTLVEPITVDNNVFYVTISIGISIYPYKNANMDMLLKFADVAMYKAKSLGRNNFQFYSSEMTDSAYEKMIMVSSLRQAILNNEFLVHYQPQVDATNDKIVGLEALVRWKHPTLGIVTPQTFIDLAEEKNLLVEIDTLVMETAMSQVGEWHHQGLFVGTLSLNVSMRWLERNNFLELIGKNMRKYKFKPEWLSLEITESQIMENPRDSIKKLKKLNDLGIELAIDDFGTGYSSLSYLNSIPVKKLKIDKSFIDDIQKKHEGETIVKAIISLAKSLNLEIIAEGVETVEQRDFLVTNGCSNIQGYYYGKPMPPESIFAEYLSGE